MIKRLILARGFKALAEEINGNVQEEHAAIHVDNVMPIVQWAEESNKLNCELVFADTGGHIDAQAWEAALLRQLSKGTQRVANLIEEIFN